MSEVKLTEPQRSLLTLFAGVKSRTAWTKYKPLVRLEELGFVSRRTYFKGSHDSYEITPAGRAWLERNKENTNG